MLTFAKIEAVKLRDEREIYRCTRKRQGCARKRQTSGRGSPPSHSFSFCPCTHLVQRIYITPHRTSAEDRCFYELQELSKLKISQTFSVDVGKTSFKQSDELHKNFCRCVCFGPSTGSPSSRCERGSCCVIAVTAKI